MTYKFIQQIEKPLLGTFALITTTLATITPNIANAQLVDQTGNNETITEQDFKIAEPTQKSDIFLQLLIQEGKSTKGFNFEKATQIYLSNPLTDKIVGFQYTSNSLQNIWAKGGGCDLDPIPNFEDRGDEYYFSLYKAGVYLATNCESIEFNFRAPNGEMQFFVEQNFSR